MLDFYAEEALNYTDIDPVALQICSPGQLFNLVIASRKQFGTLNQKYTAVESLPLIWINWSNSRNI